MKAHHPSAGLPVPSYQLNHDAIGGNIPGFPVIMSGCQLFIIEGEIIGRGRGHQADKNAFSYFPPLMPATMKKGKLLPAKRINAS